jgi:toxin ParE1/3/4
MNAIILQAARNDIVRQFDWYFDQASLVVAERFLAAVQASVSVLLEQPEIGSPRKFTAKSLVGLRSWPVKDFEDLRIYYLALPAEITVIRVLHGRRDVAALIE